MEQRETTQNTFTDEEKRLAEKFKVSPKVVRLNPEYYSEQAERNRKAEPEQATEEDAKQETEGLRKSGDQGTEQGSFLKNVTIERNEDSYDETFESKVQRIYSVLDEEELESIQEAVAKETSDRRLIFSPKLKGKAGVALMLIMAIATEENEVDAK